MNVVKNIGKTILCLVLEANVRLLRSRHKFKLIAVGGSIGKTTTKLAIAKTLEAHANVRYQSGNYNDRLTVPLVFFGEAEPHIFNVPAWIMLIVRTFRKCFERYPYDYVVAELGTDAPGQMKAFKYLRPDIYVLTAVSDEHMEQFGTLRAVAKEELEPVSYSAKQLININDVSAMYLKYLKGQAFISYGFDKAADYRVKESGQLLEIRLSDDQALKIEPPLLGMQGAKSVLAAAAVADLLNHSSAEIEQGLKAIEQVPGRLRVLKGIKNATLLDDTYNASPKAVQAALDVLYRQPSAQRIAILGSMNELGDTSRTAHETVGRYCDPKRLELVITIGRDAKNYLAPAAESNGCKVVSVMSPYEAGELAFDNLRNNAAVLAKGSQNGVFAEEALKVLLADRSDAKKLVRQTDDWLGVKRQQFGRE